MAGILKVDKYQDFNGNDIMTSDGSGNLTLNNAALKNTPAFHAYVSSSYSIANSTATKAQYNSELFDSDNCYDTSTYRFTPTSAGKYFISAGARLGSSTNCNRWGCYLYKNGSLAAIGEGDNDEQQTSIVNWVFDMNGSTDYLEVYVFQNTGSSANINVSSGTANWFTGYKLIGA